jgi:hypothetical protein
MIAAAKGFQHPKTVALYGNVMENWWFEPLKQAGKTSLSK